MTATRSYATKAWQVLKHIAINRKPNLHPLLMARANPKNALVIVMTADRGLAGAYNTNIIRYVLQRFDKYHLPVKYVTVGRKGRDLLLRMQKPVLADFSNLPLHQNLARFQQLAGWWSMTLSKVRWMKSF